MVQILKCYFQSLLNQETKWRGHHTIAVFCTANCFETIMQLFSKCPSNTSSDEFESAYSTGICKGHGFCIRNLGIAC